MTWCTQGPITEPWGTHCIHGTTITFCVQISSSTCTITVISDCMSFDIILSVSWRCPLAPIEKKIPKYQYKIPIYLNISDYK